MVCFIGEIGMPEDKFVRVIKFYCALYRKGFRNLGNLLAKIVRILFSCDIPASVVIGKGLHLPHYGLGVVIHPYTIIGDNCVIYQNVTIGVKYKGDKTFCCTLKDGVLIGCGAVILGAGEMVVGSNSKVGANSVLFCSVPDDSTAVGIPAKIISKKQ